MTLPISARLAKLAGAMVIAIAVFAMSAVAATATVNEVAYNNLNTVAGTVNGMPNEDTFSFDFENFQVGGQIELAKTAVRVPKTLTTQLDVFTCEHGEYQLENSCLTLKSSKKFPMVWTANIYAVEPNNSLGALLSSSTATFKLHFRPTTNSACPATPEGKGFGANCDVGGLLQTVTFKRFSPRAHLPEKVAILLTNSCGDCAGKPVNVGLQTSYKEWNPAACSPEPGCHFVEEPPANGGVPAIGSDPDPTNIYLKGAWTAPGPEENTFTGFQPVYTLTLASQ